MVISILKFYNVGVFPFGVYLHATGGNACGEEFAVHRGEIAPPVVYPDACRAADGVSGVVRNPYGYLYERIRAVHYNPIGGKLYFFRCIPSGCTFKGDSC